MNRSSTTLVTKNRSAPARCRTISPHVISPGRGAQSRSSGPTRSTATQVRRRTPSQYRANSATEPIIASRPAAQIASVQPSGSGALPYWMATMAS